MPSKNEFRARPGKTGGWVINRSNARHPISFHNTQTAAWKETRRLARGAASEALLEDKAGVIRTRNTYGEFLCLLEG